VRKPCLRGFTPYIITTPSVSMACVLQSNEYVRDNAIFQDIDTSFPFTETFRVLH